MMQPLWVCGTLAVQRGETTWGVAGYRMAVEKIVPYEEPRKQRKSALAGWRVNPPGGAVP